MKSLLEIPAGTLLIALGEMLHTEYANIEITKRTPHFVSGWVRKDKIEPWRPFHITATEYFAANPEAQAESPTLREHESELSPVPREELFSTSAEDRYWVLARRAWLFGIICFCAATLIGIAMAWRACSSK